MYQLLAEVRPYELAGLRPAEAERVVCDLVPEPVRKALVRAALPAADRRARLAQLGDDVERIVAKAMHKDATRRYGSAQEFADDIRRYLAGEPVLASPDSAAYRVGKFIGRHRIGSLAATLSLLAILVATATAFWQAGQARRAAADTVQVNDFLMDVLASSDPFEAGSEITMSQAVDDAAGKVATRFAGRPDLSSKVRYALGYSMTSRYKLDSAERELALALAESTAAFGAMDLRTLKVRDAIAQLRKEQDRLPEAQAMLKDLLADMEAGGLQADPLYRNVMGSLGNAYLLAEDYPQADVVLRRAADLPVTETAPTAAVDRASLLANLAQAAHGLGDVDRADTLYRQAQAGYEALHPGGSPDVAIMLNNRAQVDAGSRPQGRGLRFAQAIVRHARACLRRRPSDAGHRADRCRPPSPAHAGVRLRAGAIGEGRGHGRPPRRQAQPRRDHGAYRVVGGAADVEGFRWRGRGDQSRRTRPRGDVRARRRPRRQR